MCSHRIAQAEYDQVIEKIWNENKKNFRFFAPISRIANNTMMFILIASIIFSQRQ